MRTVLFILFLLPLSLRAYDVSQARRDFFLALKDKNQAELFCENLRAVKSQNALMLAYYGASQAIMAKHAWNPYSKLQYVRRGIKDLEKAVGMSAENLEVRFLRFSIEYYTPSFLNLSKHQDEDAKKIMALVSADKINIDDPALLHDMFVFLRNCGRFSPAELSLVKRKAKLER